jgi:AsmA-like protein
LKLRGRYVAIVLALLTGVLGVMIVFASKSLPVFARRMLIETLEERFQSTVEIGEIDVYGLAPITIGARHVVMRYHGRKDVPPLMTIDRLTVSADLRKQWGPTWRVSRVHMEGLHISVPAHSEEMERAAGFEHPRRQKLQFPPIEFAEIIADNALLQILPRQKDGKPRSFWIHNVVLRSIGQDQPAYFRAQLTNPEPEGEIDSEGKFGPWNADQPSLTPVAGKFHFANANLGQFRGLSGILSSTGHYEGVLERLDVEGETLTPDFRLSIGGNPVELKTHYVAVVDGTNGDTSLKAVEANFLQTTIIAAGDIVNPPGPAPRRISLKITLSKARAEDLLRLVTKGTNMPLTGAVKLRAQLRLAGGKSDIADRLALNGQFDISKAVFTNPDTQERIDALSRRGNGEPQNREISGVISNVRGTLLVGEGQAYFSTLEFAVPGASVTLKGAYGLHTETLDFHGRLELAAKISETTTGMKSVALRLLNPFFKRPTGGSVLPIKITGLRSNPSFGLDLRRRSRAASNSEHPLGLGQPGLLEAPFGH